MPRETLLDFFQDFAELPNEFLIYDDGFRSRSYRYNEVAVKARSFAARLRDAGIGKNDKITLYGENRPEMSASERAGDEEPEMPPDKIEGRAAENGPGDGAGLYEVSWSVISFAGGGFVSRRR